MCTWRFQPGDWRVLVQEQMVEGQKQLVFAERGKEEGELFDVGKLLRNTVSQNACCQLLHLTAIVGHILCLQSLWDWEQDVPPAPLYRQLILTLVRSL